MNKYLSDFFTAAHLRCFAFVIVILEPFDLLELAVNLLQIVGGAHLCSYAE